MPEKNCGTRIEFLDGSYLLTGERTHALVTPGQEISSAVVALCRRDITLKSRLTACLRDALAGRQTFREQLLTQTINDLRRVGNRKRPLRLEIDY